MILFIQPQSNLMMKRSYILPVLLVLAVAVTGCMADVQMVDECLTGEAVGFWEGLWHGFIAPFTFVISLFSDSVTVFEVNNNGNWYIFGFLLGIGAFSGGGTAGAGRARRKSRR